MQNMKISEIAKREDTPAESTIKRYFSDDFMKMIKRAFTDREKFLLQSAVERDIWDAEQEAKELLNKAKQYSNSARDFYMTAKTRYDLAMKKIQMLQELGLYDKPGVKRPDNEEDEDEEFTRVMFKLKDEEEEEEERKEEKIKA